MCPGSKSKSVGRGVRTDGVYCLTRQALIFANGSTHDGPMARRALAEAPDALMVAADGGARVARDYGVSLDVIIGDMDSVGDETLARLEAQGVDILRYPAEKNETDLELALQWAAEQGIRWMRVFGAMGGRLDQTLANIYLLALPALRGCDVRLVSHNQAAWMLPPGDHTIDGAKGDTVSLIPVGGPVSAIKTQNLHYPLKNETLTFGPARGISNVMDGELAKVSFADGLMLVVHTLGRA